MADTGFLRPTAHIQLEADNVVNPAFTYDNDLLTVGSRNFSLSAIWGLAWNIPSNPVPSGKILVGIEIELNTLTTGGTVQLSEVGVYDSGGVGIGTPSTPALAINPTNHTITVAGGATNNLGAGAIAHNIINGSYFGIRATVTSGTPIFYVYEVRIKIYYDDPPITEAHPNAYWIHKLTN